MVLKNHVRGYTQLTASILWVKGTVTVRKLTLITHQNESMVSIGTNALPAPRSTAEKQWDAASKQ
jgi:hypothetical protein